MKEATGELNVTVITVVAIAAVAALFYAFLWPQLKASLTANTTCADASCQSCTVSGGKRTCTGCVTSDGKNAGVSGKCTYKEG